MKSVLAHLASGLVVLALLAPYLQGFAFLLRDGVPSCGMSCCKTGKSSCHSHGHQSPKWTSDPACPEGCGQSLSLTGASTFHLASAPQATSPVSHQPILLLPDIWVFSKPGVEFSLFQRPPPSLV